jgi:hypothetical protein
MTIYISLTTIPPRIDKLDMFFYNLIKISKNNKFKIILNIPYVCNRLKEEYTIPSYINHISNIIVNRCVDYGPATKLIPTLELNFIKDYDIIIYCDDDKIYHNDWLNLLVTNIEDHPDNIVFYSGLSFYFKEDSIKFIRQETNNMPIIEGFAGVGFYRRLINNSLYENLKVIKNKEKCIKLNDDLWLSYCFYMHDLKKYMINLSKYNLTLKSSESNSITHHFDYGNDKTALKNNNEQHYIDSYNKNHYIKQWIDSINKKYFEFTIKLKPS